MSRPVEITRLEGFSDAVFGFVLTLAPVGPPTMDPATIPNIAAMGIPSSW